MRRICAHFGPRTLTTTPKSPTHALTTTCNDTRSPNPTKIPVQKPLSDPKNHAPCSLNPPHECPASVPLDRPPVLWQVRDFDARPQGRDSARAPSRRDISRYPFAHAPRICALTPSRPRRKSPQSSRHGRDSSLKTSSSPNCQGASPSSEFFDTTGNSIKSQMTHCADLTSSMLRVLSLEWLFNQLE